MRPRKSKATIVGEVLGVWVEYLFLAWLLMLALPFLSPLHWSYWQALVAVYLVRQLLKRESRP